jgi:hypothetical protein
MCMRCSRIKHVEDGAIQLERCSLDCRKRRGLAKEKAWRAWLSQSPPRLFPNWLYLSLSAFLFDRQGQRDWDVRSTTDVEPKKESGAEANKQDKASQHSSLPKQWSISLHLVATITSSISSASVVCPFSLPAISLYPSYQTCVACWSFRLA